VAWLLPELEVGLEPELKPLELLDLLELLELLGVAAVEPELEVWADPGRARATAPVTATLARVTAAVVERTLACPCFLAATARRMRSACALLMAPILRSGLRCWMGGASGLAMSLVPPSRWASGAATIGP
jgi:hypothetical protein